MLKHEDSYDTAIIRVKAIDQNKRHLRYMFDTINITFSDNLSLIGPKSRTLMGGSQLILWKTLKTGKGYVKIKFREKEYFINFNIVSDIKLDKRM